MRLRISTSTCLHCGTNFHTRHRLFRHLTSRPTKNKCAIAYVDVAPMSIDELKELDKSTDVVDRKAYIPPPVKC